MKISLRFTVVLVWISAFAIAADPQGAHSHGENTTSSSGWSELVGSMENMHLAIASVESSGNSDADFVALMLPHHQAAIEMAKTQLLFGTDLQMRRLAQEIIADQQSEIELMQLWTKQHEPKNK